MRACVEEGDEGRRSRTGKCSRRAMPLVAPPSSRSSTRTQAASAPACSAAEAHSRANACASFTAGRGATRASASAPSSRAASCGRAPQWTQSDPSTTSGRTGGKVDKMGVLIAPAGSGMQQFSCASDHFPDLHDAGRINAAGSWKLLLRHNHQPGLTNCDCS